jgi:hypothetical protein
MSARPPLPWTALAALGVAAGAAGAPSRLDGLEARLLDDPPPRLEALLVSRGAFAAELEAVLESDSAGVAAFHLRGVFGGDSVDAGWRRLPDGGLSLRARGHDSLLAAGPALDEAVWLGLTRMGLLHNAALLQAGRGPDHREGGVDGWVQALPADSATSGGDSPLALEIQVGGVPAATARLWLDVTTGLPVRREQTVRFPGGEMAVEESYRWPAVRP